MLGTVALLALFAVVGHRFGALDLAGSLLAFAMGVVVVVATEPAWVVLLLLFAGGGSLVTRVGRRRRGGSVVGDEAGPRGWRNVFGNGAAAVAVASLGFFLPGRLLAVPFAVAVAVAAADTFASEVGCLSSRAVLVTHPSSRVPPGTNGGVSWLGTMSGLLAAGGIALAGVWVLPVSWGLVPWVVLAGALGSLLDSWLGATWEFSGHNPTGILSKTHVNLLATTIPTALAFAAVVFF